MHSTFDRCHDSCYYCCWPYAVSVPAAVSCQCPSVTSSSSSIAKPQPIILQLQAAHVVTAVAVAATTTVVFSHLFILSLDIVVAPRCCNTGAPPTPSCRSWAPCASSSMIFLIQYRCRETMLPLPHGKYILIHRVGNNRLDDCHRLGLSNSMASVLEKSTINNASFTTHTPLR